MGNEQSREEKAKGGEHILKAAMQGKLKREREERYGQKKENNKKKQKSEAYDSIKYKYLRFLPKPYHEAIPREAKIWRGEIVNGLETFMGRFLEYICQNIKSKPIFTKFKRKYLPNTHMGPVDSYLLKQYKNAKKEGVTMSREAFMEKYQFYYHIKAVNINPTERRYQEDDPEYQPHHDILETPYEEKFGGYDERIVKNMDENTMENDERDPIGPPDWNDFQKIMGKMHQYILVNYPYSEEEGLYVLQMLFNIVKYFEYVDYEYQHLAFKQIASILIAFKCRLTIEIPWQPLFRILMLYYYGLRKIMRCSPPKHIKSLIDMISAANDYFAPKDVKDMLTTFTPLLCYHENQLFEAEVNLCKFLPTNHSVHLYLDDMLTTWKWLYLYPYWDWDFFTLISIIARRNCGRIDWTPYLPLIFSKIQFALDVPIGGRIAPVYEESPEINSSLRDFITAPNSSSRVLQTAARCLAWMYSPSMAEELNKFLQQLNNIMYNYYHPLTQGNWMDELSEFYSAFISRLSKRLIKEREIESSESCQPFKKPSHHHTHEHIDISDMQDTDFMEDESSSENGSEPEICVSLGYEAGYGCYPHFAPWYIPSDYRITEKLINDLVDLLYPPLQRVFFSSNELVQSIAMSSMKTLVELKPDLLDDILKMIYECFENVLKPQYTSACMKFLSFLSGSILKHRPEHLKDLFACTLPGIDLSDSTKTNATFQFYIALFFYMPIFSAEDEKALNPKADHLPEVLFYMEEFAVNFLEALLKYAQNDNYENIMVDEQADNDAISEYFLRVIQLFFHQMSESIFKLCLDRLFNVISSELIVHGMSTMGHIVGAAAQAYPKLLLEKFLPYCHKNLMKLSFDSRETTWQLHLFSRVVHHTGAEIVHFEKEIIDILDRFIFNLEKIEEKRVVNKIFRCIFSLFSTIVKLYQDHRSENMEEFKRGGHYKHWGEHQHIDNLVPQMHHMSEGEARLGVLLLDRYVPFIQKKLQDHIQGTHLLEEFHYFIKLLRGFITLCAHLIQPLDTPVPNQEEVANQISTSYPEPFLIGNASNIRSTKLSVGSLIDLMNAISQAAYEEYLAEKQGNAKSNYKINVSRVIPSIIDITFSLTQAWNGTTGNSYVIMQKYYYWVKHHLFESVLPKPKRFPRALNLVRLNIEYCKRMMIRVNFIPIDQKHYAILDMVKKWLLCDNENIRTRSQILICNMESIMTKQAFCDIISGYIDYFYRDDLTMMEREGLVLFFQRSVVIYQVRCDFNLLRRVILGICHQFHLEYSMSKEEKEEKSKQTTDFENLLNILYLEYTQVISEIRNVTFDQYTTFIHELVSASDLKGLNTKSWKLHHLIGWALLMMMRNDILYPIEGVEWFVNNLTHDNNEIQNICFEALGGILQQYATSVPRTYLYKDEEDIEDKVRYWKKASVNERRPALTKKEFEETVFIDKSYMGWNTLPYCIKHYDINAKKENPELEALRSAVDVLQREDKLRTIFNILINREEVFSESTLNFWIAGFTLFGASYFDTCKFILQEGEEHIGKGTHGEQPYMATCAEFVCGVFRCCKNWKYEDQVRILEELIPHFDNILSRCSLNVLGSWTRCFEWMLTNRDPRRFLIIINYLLTKFENSFSHSQSNMKLQHRYSKMICAFTSEITWRMPSILNRILKVCQQNLEHPYEQVRTVLCKIYISVLRFSWMKPSISTLSPKELSYSSQITFPEYVHEGIRAVLEYPFNNRNPSLNPVTLRELDFHSTSVKDLLATIEYHKFSFSKEHYSLVNMIVELKFISYGPSVFGGYIDLLIKKLCIMAAASYMNREENNADLTYNSFYAMMRLADCPHSKEMMNKVFSWVIDNIGAFSAFRIRIQLLEYLNVLIFQRKFVLDADKENRLYALLIHYLCDENAEVRKTCKSHLTNLIGASLQRDVFAKKLFHHCKHIASSCSLKKGRRRRRDGRRRSRHSTDMVKLHGAMLGCQAIIGVYTFDIPTFLPNVIAFLASYSNDHSEFVKGTVRDAMTDFWKAHQEFWDMQKSKFSEEQLAALGESYVSPYYYA